MLIDTRAQQIAKLSHYDVCVIGAGPAGITIARSLAAANVRVALLESGGTRAERHTEELSVGTVAGGFLPDAYLSTSRLRMLGGGTNHWEGWSRPLDPQDFASRSWVSNSGWPLPFEQFAPYVREAERILGLGPFPELDERATRAGACLAADALEGFATRMIQVSRVNFRTQYDKELRASPHIFLHLHAHVVELQTSHSNRGLSGVKVVLGNDQVVTVRARWYVLACGGVENARTLLASRAVRTAGIGNDHDLVGRYFMEHPHLLGAGRVCAFLPAPVAATYLNRGVYPWSGDNEVFGLFSASAQLQREQQILRSSVRLLGVGQLDEETAAYQRLFETLYGRRRDTGYEGRMAMLVIRSEQAPDPTNRVVLTAERDRYGVPRARLEARLTELDWRTAETMVKQLGHALATADVGYVSVAPRAKIAAGFGAHHLGTTRMGASSSTGVVDSDCRVFSVPNLYIAGSSVFPTGGWANPTLNLLALALRLSDRLKRQLDRG